MNHPRLSEKLLAVLALLWLALTASAYFITHKPFSPDQALIAAQAVGRVLAAGMLVCAAGGLGRKIAPATTARPGVWMGVQAALGAGVLSLVMLFTGTALGVSRWLSWVLLALLVLWLRREILNWGRQLRGALVVLQPGSLVERLAALAAVLILLLALLPAMAPPLKFDALVYHLALPQEYLDSGKITYLRWAAFWGMPQTGEMLYTWAASLLDLQTAAVLGWLLGALGLFLTASICAEHCGSAAGWAAAASLMSGYTLASALSWAYVDWLALLFGAAMLPVIYDWIASGKARSMLLAGAMAGLALGVKYTAGVLALGGLVAIFWAKRRSPVEAVRPALYFGMAVLLVSLPWWLKNALATGNPFYPFFAPSGSMDALRLALLQSQPAWGGWQDAFLLPWQATIQGVEGTPGYSASIGPLLLGLSGAAYLGLKERAEGARRMLALAGVVLLTGMLVWAAAGRLSGLLIQSRLYLALFPAAAILAGAGFDALSAIRLKGVRFHRLAGILMLLVLYLNVFQLGDHTQAQGAGLWLTGRMASQEYLEKNLGMYAVVMRDLADLPDGSRVLMLWEPRSLYCRPTCEPDELVDRWLRDYRHYGSAQDVRRSWQEAGYTHLLVFAQGVEYFRGDARYRADDWAALDDLLSKIILETDYNQAYRLYSIRQP